jgi:outer membrane protein TolC
MATPDANLDAATSRQRIAVQEYGRSVQTALREVEDALVGFQKRREQRAALERIVAASRERLRLVDLRYLNGISSYFEVLDSQRAYAINAGQWQRDYMVDFKMAYDHFFAKKAAPKA